MELFLRYVLPFPNVVLVLIISLGTLTKRKFDNSKHVTETFKKYALLQYHLKSIMDADNFIKTEQSFRSYYKRFRLLENETSNG
jgi:hypothetical protein